MTLVSVYDGDVFLAEDSKQMLIHDGAGMPLVENSGVADLTAIDSTFNRFKILFITRRRTTYV